MIIDCIADLHGHYPKLEGGDLLIVAGDCLKNDDLQSRINFFVWLQRQRYKKRIYVSGNHDNSFQKRPPTEAPEGIYLCDSGTEFEGFKIWGSPWTLAFDGINPHCTAFTGTEDELAAKFVLIPDDVDILITHGPPFTILDKTADGRQVGSVSLMGHHMKRLRPKLFVWGHIHESYGQDGGYTWNNTKYVNCSHVNERYQPINKPIRIIL